MICCRHNRFAANLSARLGAFLDAVRPFRDEPVVGVKRMFAWYWIADLCETESIPFVLGHAQYMKAIHDSETLALIKR